jgi:hypothetical protein
MKLPRWLVTSMLAFSVLAGIGLPMGWWLTLPYRTARRFVELVESGKTVEAQDLVLVTESEWDQWGRGLGSRRGEFYPRWLVYLPRRPLELTAQWRSPAEMFRGEQEFLIGRKHKMRVARDKVVSARRVESQ